MNRIASGLLALILALPAGAAAKSVREPGADGWCGTRASTAAISYARHQYNQQRLERDRPNRLAVGQPGLQQAVKVTKQKNIAVIEDDGTIFPPPRFFDLRNDGVEFRRGGPKTLVTRFFGGVNGNRGDRIEIGDDASRAIDLPFAFTFYGTVYNRVFLNSDGNLTFNQADNASTARSLPRFLEGPPRIAADFLDLDPSVTSGTAGVYLLVQPGLVRITWVDVPEFGASNRNTFQVTLFPPGRITIAFGNIDANVGIVGVSPGGPGLINLVDLSQTLPAGPTSNAIAEEFRDVSEIDDIAASRAVFSAVRDEYDMLVLFADFPVDLGNAIAYHAPVKNTIRGIDPFGSFDISSVYGSNGRLEGFIQMGSLSQYPAGPNNPLNIFGNRASITVLAHEVGHRWLAFARFINGQGQVSTDLLGRQLGHWSFLLDTDGSIMEGNDIRDNGDGTFTTLEPYQGFSPLDLYLMGYLRPDQVPPFLLVGGANIDADTAPDDGVVISGQRQTVNLNQIIAAQGPRVPNSAQAQKVIQVAFALLGRQGEPPSLDSVKKVNQYRNRLSTYFREKTGGRGRIATWLRLKKAQGQTAPASAAKVTPPPTAAGGAPTGGGEAEVRAEPIEPARRFDRLDDPARR